MFQDVPSFLAYWRNARSRTLRVLEALAPDDMEWAPVPGAFSFGDLFRHLVGLERFMYAENAQGRPRGYPARLAAPRICVNLWTQHLFLSATSAVKQSP